ncbi:MAG TPA: hypothetical protein VHL52_10270 [Acidimicrobiia bacterium]|nr:hypothetical protein [Acidimicrobiia bacterium]
MKAVRRILALAIALVAVVALPASAFPTSDLVRVSPWTAGVDVRGLENADAARVASLWAEFVAGTPSQSSCLLASPPRIEAKADMAPRAAYSPSTATLFVKPGDLDRLVVFHELAHHLDFTCGAADEIGDELRQAQGLSASKPWWQHGDPVTWPAEYFANAVAISLGEHSRHAVTAETVEVVEGWMGRRAPTEPKVVPVLTIGQPGPDVPRVA